MQETEKKKLIILPVSHLLTHYKKVYGFVTSETRVLKNPSKIVTSSVFWNGFKQALSLSKKRKKLIVMEHLYHKYYNYCQNEVLKPGNCSLLKQWNHLQTFDKVTKSPCILYVRS